MLKINRVRRHKSIRRNIIGTEARPRVAVFRSTQHIYAQVIDDSKNMTMVAESDLAIKTGTKTEKALQVGETLAKKMLAKKLDNIVFDRGGILYHGRVAAVAEGLRKGGIKF